MRSTFRLFLAAILFTAVAGFVSAQDTSSAPPPAPPEVVKPVDALPVVPVASEPQAPVVEAAPVVEQAVPVVEPVAVPAVVAEKPAVTTVKRVSKKTATKPAIHLKKTVEAAAPVAVPAPVEKVASAPPPEAAVVAAPLKSVAPPPPPPAKAAAVETGTKTVTSMGLGGWLIALLVVAALFWGITLFRRRQTAKRTSIVDLVSPASEMDPAYVTRR